MKRTFGIILLLAATTAGAQQSVARVADDAIVLDRVAEASKRDLPRDLLKRIVNEDIDILRGRRADGSYEYASWERLEAGRQTEDFSVHPRGGKSVIIGMKGTSIYRVILDSPSRRMIVAKNRPVTIERVEIEYVPDGSTLTKRHVVEVNAPLIPGESRPIDLPDIARQATVRVQARGDEDNGYGNIVISLVQARIVDRADSPYADAVASAKAILRALDNNDVPSIRAMAARLRDSLASERIAAVPTPAARTIEVTAPRDEAAASHRDLHAELQAIEDLLTGTDAERREGLDKLHQLVRRTRPR